ncbi:MAG TPA: thiamine pyrophosphate-binding protein [Geobacteraceae bacterium]|nr:thiamine pyrophosphate-binding protein [Geobacteraceae bacterium]
MTLSDLIVDYLEQFGVEYVFGVPGSPLGPLFDALARSERRGGPRAVLTRHESGAAFISDGYARTSGRIGVCCSTTGPGATNLITGVCSAHAEKVPMLVITSQTRIADFSRGCFQDSSRDGVDIMGMFDHCTRFNSMVTHPDQLERKLAAALTAALGSPRGPAHLSIPVDIFAAEAGGPASYTGLHALINAADATVDGAALELLCAEVTEVLGRHGKILLLVGHNGAGAGEEITRFAELAGAAIVTTPRGKPVINPYHPLARGVFGCSGHLSARRTLSDEAVELVLAVGTNLGEWSTSRWDPLLMNNKMIHIHSDRTSFARSPMARLHVQGKIGAIFTQLNDRFVMLKRSGEATHSPMGPGDPEAAARAGYLPANITVHDPASCRSSGEGRPIKPPHLFAELIRRLPRETRFFIDNSNSVPWSIHYFFHPRPESYHLSIEFASMAWAIGAAVGSSFGNRRAPSVCITGDGCYLMSGQEITVAMEQKLPVLFVVLNDRAYGLIRHGHRLLGTEQVDFSIPPVNFAMMAGAIGAQSHTIRDAKDFDRIDWETLAIRQGPTLLEVLIDPEERPPLAMG